jgi:hypothetical protein
MKKKKVEKVTVQEEEQVALVPKVAAENKEEEGPGDKEGQVLEDWVKHLQLVVNGRSRISRRYPTKDRLIEHLRSCGAPASITDKKSILENLVFKTVPLDRNDLFHSGSKELVSKHHNSGTPKHPNVQASKCQSNVQMSKRPNV